MRVNTVENPAIPEIRSGDLFRNLLLFARGLKEKGFKITPGRVVDAARSLSFVDLSIRQDFAGVLRANFASSREELSRFDQFFREFWNGPEPPSRKPSQPSIPEGEAEGGGEENFPLSAGEETSSKCPEKGAAGEAKGFRYSAAERLSRKDFSSISTDEAPLLAREMRRLLSSWVVKTSRRKKPAGQGRGVDFRRSFPRMVRYGGEILELIRKQPKEKPLKVIVLCDVSGSMDAAACFTLQFLHALQRAFPRNETFVFSTRLTRITDLLKRNPWPGALREISDRVRDWSGGTRIGESLRTFNERYAKGLAAGSMVVVFISDGWDRGNAGLLEEGMKRLKRRARRVIWMNPLLGSPGYEPICRGMKAALPYVDHFLPASSLRSFEGLGEFLIPSVRR